MKCCYCHRDIQLDGGVWIDPAAIGDDSVWREVCDSHDSFPADQLRETVTPT